METIGKIEFYEDRYSGTIEFLKGNKIIKNIDFIVQDNGKIELFDFLDLFHKELHREAINRIKAKIKSKY